MFDLTGKAALVTGASGGIGADIARALHAAGATVGLSGTRANHEGAIVEMIHEAREAASAIIINPAAYTHTSVAILDALNAFEGPVFEVHISNVHKRESFRHHSYVSLRADGVMAGFGTEGYLLALRRAVSVLKA